MVTGLSDLPGEVLSSLFSPLTHTQWSAIARVCREWRHTISHLRHRCIDADEISLGVDGFYSVDETVRAAHRARWREAETVADGGCADGGSADGGCKSQLVSLRESSNDCSNDYSPLVSLISSLPSLRKLRLHSLYLTDSELSALASTR